MDVAGVVILVLLILTLYRLIPIVRVCVHTICLCVTDRISLRVYCVCSGYVQIIANEVFTQRTTSDRVRVSIVAFWI